MTNDRREVASGFSALGCCASPSCLGVVVAGKVINAGSLSLSPHGLCGTVLPAQRCWYNTSV